MNSSTADGFKKGYRDSWGTRSHYPRPSVIRHVGAYMNVDRADRESNRALAVNAQGTTVVVYAAATLNARLS